MLKMSKSVALLVSESSNSFLFRIEVWIDTQHLMFNPHVMMHL